MIHYLVTLKGGDFTTPIILKPVVTVVEAETDIDTFYTVSANTFAKTAAVTFNKKQFTHILNLIRVGKNYQGAYGVLCEDDRGFTVLHSVGAMSSVAKVYLTPAMEQALLNAYLHLN